MNNVPLKKPFNYSFDQRRKRFIASFAQKVEPCDKNGEFVTHNYALLKDSGFFSLGIPSQFGGGDASYSQVCQFVRDIAYHCGSTALAFAMHSHGILMNVFKWKQGVDEAEEMLKDIASNQWIMCGTGASDWLSSSGEATPINGGYLVNAHKRFVSNSTVANILVTSAIVRQGDYEEIIHFSIPMNSHGINLNNNWDTLGMRGTGSNDLILSDVFVPECAIVLKRPIGEWHSIFNITLPVGLPVIVSCYAGLIDKARNIAIKAAKNKEDTFSILGSLDNQYTLLELALDDMIHRSNDLKFSPSIENTKAILARKTIATEAVNKTIQYCESIVGGSSYCKENPLERIARDVKAMQFHPLPQHYQEMISGRILCGLTPV